MRITKQDFIDGTVVFCDLCKQPFLSSRRRTHKSVDICEHGDAHITEHQYCDNCQIPKEAFTVHLPGYEILEYVVEDKGMYASATKVSSGWDWGCVIPLVILTIVLLGGLAIYLNSI